ncbi:hypothetical protein FHR32_003319 [Streptosporangium album]|uniref:Uncharacterized protein n=1 Tax=Streptosporangium album TaxID=47479 RepID=A0A7W7WAC0_9ACTN|nr:hypothetical protein [Streptosporangium album]MBB4939014.1 hypothetical protein [Streptosporangium album]
MNKALFDEVSVLFAEQRGLTYPDDLISVEIYGHSMLLIDSDMAGCVTSYVGHKRGVLDADQLRIVRECARDLGALVPRLRRREGRTYAARWLRIAELIMGDSQEGARYGE